MSINDFLTSGFKFSEDESFLQFKFRMLNSIFFIIALFATLLGVLSSLGLYDIGDIQTKANYMYGVSALLLLLVLRRSKAYYEQIAHTLLFISFATFFTALLVVPQDEFRMIWFYLLIFVAYAIQGTVWGLLYTAVSILAFLSAYFFFGLHFSGVATMTTVFSLVIGSLLSLLYVYGISAYKEDLRQRNNSLSLLASTDYLTGIMNKRIFNELSKHYFKTAQRDGFGLTLFLLDLDHFKDVNDIFGHQAGDKLLKHFVETLQNTIRSSDIFARIGGEEFAILVSKKNINDSYMFAEKIRRKVENISMEYHGRHISITTSIGMSVACKTDLSFDDIFLRADAALYKAKNEGRNQTQYIRPSDKLMMPAATEAQNVFLNFSI